MPGGVCAVLDYEVGMMAEYVADMAMRVVMPKQTVTVAFRKFVAGVLTSTRLPSTTILLGMNYLAKRINYLKAQPTPFSPAEGQVWRMLTVSLLLGSKFLDDNTFQNRSWAEVSGIRVQDLNEMEYQWLRDSAWGLYVNLDKSDDYNAWLSNWNEWQSSKKQEQMAHRQRSERVTPIVTSMRTQHHHLAYDGWTPDEVAEHERFSLARKQPYRPREGSWHGQYQNAWQAAPLTPPDSGYGTPEYLNSAASVNAHYNEWFDNAVVASYSNRGYKSANNFSNTRAAPHYQQPYFGHYRIQNTWDTGSAECSCPQCMATLHKTPHYFHQQHLYGQTIMG